VLDWLAVKDKLRPLHPREAHPVPIVQEAGWAPGPVWAGAENLDPTTIRPLPPPVKPVASRMFYFTKND